MKYHKKARKDHENILDSTAWKSSNAASSCLHLSSFPILYPVLVGPLHLAPDVQRAGALIPRFARKIRLEWNTCNGRGFSWLTLNRSAGPR